MWPRNWTFDLACCEGVETNIKHHKAKETSDKSEGKSVNAQEVLKWFKEEGENDRKSVKLREMMKLDEERKTKQQRK